MPDPLVSVVVPTHNRPARLRRLLSSLREQALEGKNFEVIVVDDGSQHETRELLASEAARAGLILGVVQHPVGRGPAAARNSGWRNARAPLVAFTDDDCVADKDWLTAALRAYAQAPGAIIQGRTEPDPAELENDGLLSRTVRVNRLGPQYEACNIFYPRSILEALGGFDERFGARPAAEDTDLAWRAIEQGCDTRFAPDALVLHAVERLGMGGMLRVASRWDAAMRLFAEHPRTRTILYRSLFWNVWHYLLWRTLLALPGPSWLRRFIVARHLLELQKRARLAGAGTAAVPFLLLHDVVECWSVARGAIRYRTFVL